MNREVHRLGYEVSRKAAIFRGDEDPGLPVQLVKLFARVFNRQESLLPVVRFKVLQEVLFLKPENSGEVRRNCLPEYHDSEFYSIPSAGANKKC